MTRISDRALLWTTFACAAIFALIAFDADAQEQVHCAPFAAMAKELEKHKEVQLAGGIVNDENAVIVFGTPTGSTWTLVAVSTNGNACIIGSGTGWFQSDLMTGQPV